MEVTTSWVVHVGCRYSFWSLFSRDSEDGRISIIVGRKLFKHCVLGELSVVDTVSARVWLVVVDLNPRTDKPGDR